ncbi:MAG: biopolymer transporter ExbD [Glaciimonas sp.]|nr:biopolymer transporter ExbD [Glaciimonas sp.]
MAFGGFNDNQHPAPMADINITPMVDVMLVLLVIFIITAPLFTHAVKIDLPKAKSAPAPEKPETIALSIDHAGKMYWNDALITESELAPRLIAAAQKRPQSELQLRADKDTRYQVLAEVMSLAQNNGMTKIGFVNDPKKTQAAK